jgi:hypothetical protein
MRLLAVILFSVVCFSAKAQSPYFPGSSPFMQRTMLNPYHMLPDSNSWNKKWSLQKYAGMSTGFLFSQGTSATFLAAPVGLQLTRRLTNNVYAFAGVSVAPTYLHFNRSFDPSYNKNFPGGYATGLNQFNLSPKAELGLLYVNDQRTFSISGSFGVSRNSYPGYQGYPPYGFPVQQPVMPSRH